MATSCTFFQRGHCVRGNSCKYAHTAVPPTAFPLPNIKEMSIIGKEGHSETTAIPCAYFQRGHCSRGTSCSFTHSMPPRHTEIFKDIKDTSFSKEFSTETSVIECAYFQRGNCSRGDSCTFTPCRSRLKCSKTQKKFLLLVKSPPLRLLRFHVFIFNVDTARKATNVHTIIQWLSPLCKNYYACQTLRLANFSVEDFVQKEINVHSVTRIQMSYLLPNLVENY